MRRALVVGLLLMSAAPAMGAVPLEEAWARVRTELHAGRPEAVAAEINSLQRLGASLGVRRMPAYAEALVRWAESDPGENGLQALQLATRLDVRCADARFAIANRRWEKANVLGAAVAYASGWRDCLLRPETRRRLATSLLLCAQLSVTIAFVLGLAIQTLRYAPELFHDGRELGKVLFDRPNARVFAGVVCVLPLFGGLDPIWLLGYALALTWIYFPVGERLIAVIGWLLLVLAVPGLELWGISVLQQRSPITAAGQAVEHQVVRPMVLDRLMAVAPNIEGNAAFHELAGALLHMHGETGAAREEFRTAHRVDRERATPHVWLGCMGLEEGNVGLAIQEFRKALQLKPSATPIYHNLSVALDRAHLFQEADETRSAGAQQEKGGQDYHYRLIDGDRVAFPANGPELVDEIITGLPREKLRLLGVLGPRGRPLDWATSPMSLAFLCPAVLGAVLFWARRRWMWVARSCARCGQVFCERCKTSSMSGSYCGQCISVFLKQDAVSVEQRAAKLAQIRRRKFVRSVTRRILAVVLPGTGCIVRGNFGRGLLMIFAAALLVLVTFVWLPEFVRTVVFSVSILPVQIVVGTLFAFLWLASLRLSWGER